MAYLLQILHYITTNGSRKAVVVGSDLFLI